MRGPLAPPAVSWVAGLAILGCTAPLAAPIERLANHSLALPVLEPPSRPLLPRSGDGSPVAATAAGGHRAAFIGFGTTGRALLGDPRRPEAVLEISVGHRSAFGPTLARGDDPTSDRWAASHFDGLTLFEASADGVVATDVPLDSRVGVTLRRSLARVVGTWWVAGVTLERVLDDGTVLEGGAWSPAPWGCVSPRPLGGWGVSLVGSSLEIVALDTAGAVVGAPTSIPDTYDARGCAFRSVAGEAWLCVERQAGYGGTATHCVPAAEAAAGLSPSARRFDLARLEAAGADGALGYVFPAGGAALARWDPVRSEIAALVEWPGHDIIGVVDVGGTLWAIATIGEALVAGEVDAGTLEVVSVSMLASGPPHVEAAIDWAAPSPGGPLLGAWRSEATVVDERGERVRFDARCGIVLVPLAGEPVVTEDPRACDGVVVPIAEAPFVLTGDGLLALEPDLAVGARIGDAPALPLLSGGPRALFGTFECTPATGCLLSTATLDADGTVAVAEPREVCGGSMGPLTAAGADWGFVVAFRCANSVRVVQLDADGAFVADQTIAADRSVFGIIEDEAFEVVSAGSRVAVVVQAGSGPVHVFAYRDGAPEPPIVAPGPGRAWPSTGAILLPDSGAFVDLDAGTVVTGLDWLTTLDAAPMASLYDAGDGSTWIASSDSVLRVAVTRPR